MTVARYVVEALRLAGTDTFFGAPVFGQAPRAPGFHKEELWTAVGQAGARSVRMGHEQAAAHAADGYGRASGHPGAVFLPSGPGALNALSALGEALVSSSPVVAVAATIPSRLVGKGKGELHESKDPLPAYEAVTKFAARAMRAGDVPELLAQAIAKATSGRPGPALVEIPSDVLEAELDAAPEAFSPERPPPSAEVVADAVTLLRLAARPVVWAGGGVLRSGASAQLLRLAERLGAPVATTFMGKGAISERHPLALGTLVRFPAVQATIAQADLLVAVGTRFSAMSTSRWRMDLPPQMIQVDVDRVAIGRNYPVRLPVVADAKVALGAIADALGSGVGPDRTEEVARLRMAAFERARREGPHEMDLLRAIGSALPPEAVTVHDMTAASAWAAPFLSVEVPGTFHTPYGFGSAGFALPAAIGVSCALPGRPVVVFAGRRSLAYHSRELGVLAQHRSPVTVLVFDDDEEEARLEDLADAAPTGTPAGGQWVETTDSSRWVEAATPGRTGPNLAVLAAAYGLPAERAPKPDDLERVLSRAVKGDEPRLVEVPGAWGPPAPGTSRT